MLELWHEWNSVHSFKVRVVLAEKGLEWREHRIELLKFEHLQPAYLKLNPNGVVPTLMHEGRVVLESSVICQYLEERFPDPHLLPADLHERARARIWLKYFDDVVHPAVRLASFQLLYKPMLAHWTDDELAARLRSHPDPVRAQAFRDAARGATDFDAVRKAFRAFRAIIDALDRTLDGAWLCGSAFGLADAAMAPFAERLEILGMEQLWQVAPRARAWKERILARRSIILAGAPPEHRLSGPSHGMTIQDV